MAELYNILKEPTTFFATESTKAISSDIINYQQMINQMLLDIKNINRRRSRESKAIVLKNGYALIMNIREKFLQEPITYRLYLRYENEGEKTKVVDMSTQEVLNLVGYERGGLRLRRFSDSAIRNIGGVENQQYEQYVQMHYEGVMRGLAPVSSKSYTGYRVHKTIMERYNYPENLRKKNSNNYRTFNMGWIYQALDQTFSELYTEDINPPVPEDTFEKEYFSKNLAYDNLVGFKGGDVGMVQIKANAASLMSLTTIRKYLNELQSIFNGLQILDKNTLTEKLKGLFIDTEGEFSQLVEDNISKALDNMLASVK